MAHPKVLGEQAGGPLPAECWRTARRGLARGASWPQWCAYVGLAKIFDGPLKMESFVGTLGYVRPRPRGCVCERVRLHGRVHFMAEPAD